MSSTTKTLEQSEVEKLIAFFEQHKLTYSTRAKRERNLLITRLMLDAGLRVGEVIKLLFSDVYFNCLPVTSIVIRSDISKTKKERSIPVNSKLRDAFKIYSLQAKDYILKYSSLPLFLKHPCQLPITVRQVERIIGAAGRIAIGRKVTPHMLRHTFATRLMKITDIRTIQQLLGHASITSTQIYTHPSGEDLREAVNAI